MKHTISIIIGVLILLFLIWWYIRLSNINSHSSNTEELFRKIDQLELKIDSLNNLKVEKRRVIDSTHVKIVTNEKHYQERINTIVSQPLSVDSQFISDYIGRYIESHKSYFQ